MIFFHLAKGERSMKNFVYIIIFILSIIITQKINRIISSHIVFETTNHAFRRIFAIWVISFFCLGGLANKVGLIDLNNEKTSANQSSVQEVQKYEGDSSVEDQYAGAKEYYEDNGGDADEETNYGEDAGYEEENYEEDDNEELQEYIFSESDTRILSAEEIKKYNSDVLRIAKNEIYARHGRMFNDSELQEYFDSLSWYEGTIAPEDFDESVLSKTEKENVKLLAEYESKK